MPTNLTDESDVLPCPADLLVRRTYGAGFDAYVRTHDIVRLLPGVYVDQTAWRDLAPWERYLAKVHAVRHKRPDAVFVLESAAVLRGHPVLPRQPYVHVLADTKGAARITGTIQGHYFSDPITPEQSSGFLHTSAVDTGVDLARVRHPAYGLAVLDHIIRTRASTIGEITATNDARDSSRGRSAARWAISRATGIPESVLESISIAVIEWLGFESPELQASFDIGELGTARVDTYWPRENVMGEADGDSKYRMHPGGTEAALIQEKKREDALRRLADGFARWGWSACRRPEVLEKILADEGVRRVRPRDNTRLRTVRALLAP
ncbi:hypothetical protein [Microbacterium suaedae]|uniref:hypothetical protein n=1 Tax=Microbacterium suaedae TaxID=2067813 RepID=UPI000DA249CD|nr:hypothetical protein [Microbacterium suaedae]